MSTVTVEGKELRYNFIRKLIAEGDYEVTLVAKCQASPLFERELAPSERERDHKRRRVRPLGRKSIKLYVRQVRRQLFDTDFDPGEELRLSYERMVRAFQMAVKAENVGGMVRAQREISRFFDFGQGDGKQGDVCAERIREQVQQMDLSIGNKLVGLNGVVSGQSSQPPT